MLRNLQEDYLSGAAKSGMVAAAGLTSRVLRVARLLLLEYASLSPRMLGEVDLLVTLMLHSMQPFRGDTDNGAGEVVTGTLPDSLSFLSHKRPQYALMLTRFLFQSPNYPTL